MPPVKKKRKDEDDEDAKPARKKKAAAAEDDDEEEEADEDEEDDDAADSDDEDDDDESEDDDEEAESDDDDEEDDDDDSDSDDDDDDAEDEEDADDDEEEPAPKKSKSSGSGEAISWDTDDAESGGLPEGRVVLLNPRTRRGDIHDYPTDDPDGVPLLSIDAVPSGKDWDEGARPFEIHLSAGKAERIIPNDDGTDFIANPEAPRASRGLNKSTNTYYFIKSLEDAGFPKKKMRMKGIRSIHGCVAELVRVPQPKRTQAASAESESTRFGGDSMPSISGIYAFPWDAKGEKARAAAEAALAKFKKGGKGKGKARGAVASRGAKQGRPKEDDEAGAPSGAPSAGPSAKKVKTLAERAVLAAIKTPAYKRKGLPIADLYTAAFQQVKTHPARAPIMKLVKDESFYTHDDRPWFYEEKTETLRLVE